MSSHSTLDGSVAARERKSTLYGRVTLLVVAAVVICTAIINYRAIPPVEDLTVPLLSQLFRALYSLLPYMISAVVAIITVMAIGFMIPAARNSFPAAQIAYHLKLAAAGNLSTRMKVEGNKEARELAADYNQAMSNLSQQLAGLKIINRRQWEALCAIREAVGRQDETTALVHITEMERNWARIAEIENRLTT